MGESSLTSLLINSNEKSSASLHDKTSQSVFVKSPHLSWIRKGKTTFEFNILSTHFLTFLRLRVVPHFVILEKSRDFVPTRWRGVSQSQLLVKFFPKHNLAGICP